MKIYFEHPVVMLKITKRQGMVKVQEHITILFRAKKDKI